MAANGRLRRLGLANGTGFTRGWADAGVPDRLFDALQEHHMIRVSIDCLGPDRTSVKRYPDGMGAPQKTDRK